MRLNYRFPVTYRRVYDWLFERGSTILYEERHTRLMCAGYLCRPKSLYA